MCVCVCVCDTQLNCDYDHDELRYQGEANSHRDVRAYSRAYSCPLQATIRDWRAKWKAGTDGPTDGHFPFRLGPELNSQPATGWPLELRVQHSPKAVLSGQYGEQLRRVGPRYQ